MPDLAPGSSSNDGRMALDTVPSLISARSANTLISENRPTRIQAETLLVLNGVLDELLLTIISSAKSLATNRIKTDGVLRVLGNNVLAKDAVLEAELELRSYVEGRRAEGAKVPLGLMATSRLDGTDGFPVQSAYKALQSRCQYYSTLSDSHHDESPKDQNIMSSDGRPIATVTPGAAIYVTALLEYIGQHILQNVSRVIERDNSDEASLYDLRAAISEDEQLNPLFTKMSISSELARRIDTLESRRRKPAEDGTGRGVRSDARAVRPWHVPSENDFDEAAGPTLFSSKRASLQPSPRHDNTASSVTSSSRQGPAASSSIGHADSIRGSMSTLRTSSSVANTSTVDSTGGPSLGNKSVGKQSSAQHSVSLGYGVGRQEGGASNGSATGPRPSSERAWSGMFSTLKRRSSFKQGSESAPTSSRPTLLTDDSFNSNSRGSALEPEDDFEALLLSGPTMKVSLTPNRLQTIEIAKKPQTANISSASRRPGTANTRDDPAPTAAVPGRGPGPSPGSHTSAFGDGSPDVARVASGRPSASSTILSDVANSRSNPRASTQQTTLRPERKLPAPPPSSYRSPSPSLVGQYSLPSGDVVEEDTNVTALARPPLIPRSSTPRLLPRDDDTDQRTSTSKDLVDLFKSTPPSATSAIFSGIGSETSSLADGASKKSAMGDRVRILFGRKASSSNGHSSPSSPSRRTFLPHQYTDTKASLDDSRDTHITSSSTNNSIDQKRSVVSPSTALSDRHAASRSSMSTPEHPPQKAEAAAEAKPDASVREMGAEPLSAKAAIGLGVGIVATADAVGALAAAQNASLGSRSTSYASQTPSTAEGAVQEEVSADDSSSTSRSAKPTEELVSRKVPWGYKRSSVGAGTMGERNGTPLADRRRSVGYQSSNGHGGLLVRGQGGAASSENGHSPMTAASTSNIVSPADEETVLVTSNPSIARGNNAPTAWSGSGSQTMARRGSLGARPSSTLQARRSSMNLETIQLLADLERAMRNCHNVEECRALVRKAMHSDGAALAPSESSDGGVRDNKVTPTSSSKATEAIAAGAALTVVATAPGAKVMAAQTARANAGSRASREVEISQSATTNGQEDGVSPSSTRPHVKPSLEVTSTSLESVDQALVAAWLLGGDEDPAPTCDASSDKLSSQQEHLDQKRVVRGPVSAAELTESMDSSASRGGIQTLASGSVASLQSNYKDASDEVTVE